MAGLKITSLTGRAGASVEQIDLANPLDTEAQASLVSALDRHGVLFFPAHAVSQELLVSVARIFGEPVRPAVPGEQKDRQPEQIREFVNQAVEWHADTTWMTQPPGEQIFQVMELPEFGGDTIWASTEAAYDTLNPALRRLVDDLQAVHDDGRILANFAGTAKWPTGYQHAIHPVVRVHPRSGRRSLFVNPLYTSRILGLSAVESRHLLDLLYAHIALPEHFVRHRWKVGELAVWDNRSTWHYAVGDYGDQNRRVHRVSTAGEVPAGITSIENAERAV